jgi:hypothetical protein
LQPSSRITVEAERGRVEARAQLCDLGVVACDDTDGRAPDAHDPVGTKRRHAQYARAAGRVARAVVELLQRAIYGDVESTWSDGIERDVVDNGDRR